MSANAVHGYGCVVKRATVALLGVFDVSAPPGQFEMDAIESTDYSSASGVRQYVGGLISTGEVVIESELLPVSSGDFKTLRDDQLARTLVAFTFEFSDSGVTTVAFNALVQKLETAAPIDGKLSYKATLKISGLPVWTD
jgi:hypothetical protein